MKHTDGYEGVIGLDGDNVMYVVYSPLYVAQQGRQQLDVWPILSKSALIVSSFIVIVQHFTHKLVSVSIVSNLLAFARQYVWPEAPDPGDHTVSLCS